MKARTVASLLAIVVLATGCTYRSIDPTDPSHFTDVLVLNDTPANVVLVQCEGTSCDTLNDRTDLDSGHAMTLNVLRDDSAGAITWEIRQLVLQGDG